MTPSPLSAPSSGGGGVPPARRRSSCTAREVQRRRRQRKKTSAAAKRQKALRTPCGGRRSPPPTPCSPVAGRMGGGRAGSALRRARPRAKEPRLQTPPHRRNPLFPVIPPTGITAGGITGKAREPKARAHLPQPASREPWQHALTGGAPSSRGGSGRAGPVRGVAPRPRARYRAGG